VYVLCRWPRLRWLRWSLGSGHGRAPQGKLRLRVRSRSLF